jgi:hypothetical protein
LCTPSEPEEDELRFTDDQFTEAEFDEAYAYFDRELARALDTVPSTAALTAREGFWIGYHNRLMLMRGFTLKQAALLERSSHPGDTTLASDSTSALARYCEFLQRTVPVD